MRFIVRELPRSKADKRAIAKWLHERSLKGAASWLDAYDDAVTKLESHADSFGEAPENEFCEFEVKQTFFKTRRGRIYRLLYFIEGQVVYVLRIRGPGQAPVDPEEMKSE